MNSLSHSVEEIADVARVTAELADTWQRHGLTVEGPRAVALANGRVIDAWLTGLHEGIGALTVWDGRRVVQYLASELAP